MNYPSNTISNAPMPATKTLECHRHLTELVIAGIKA